MHIQALKGLLNYMKVKDVLNQVRKDNVKFVLLQFTDIMGIVKSITITAERLEESFEFGTWFDGSSIQGFTRIFESDMYLKPDPNTYAVIPWLDSDDGNTARFICDVYTPDGKPFEGDPRYVLKKAMQEAEDMGFTYYTGPELEFFLFKRGDDGNFEALPHDQGGYFDLSTDLAYNLRRDMNVALSKFGIEIEASHHEVAAGQHEIDFKYSTALKTADNAMTMRFVLKAIAQKHDLHVTFMPKPIAGINGSGMHVHQSLFKGDDNVFYDENDKYFLSQTAKQFIAGQLKHVKAMISVLSPTVNSYKRLVPGYEAPVYLSWGTTNRSALIRIPRVFKGKIASTRAEIRCPDPTANVYLAFAVLLKSGLDGIKNNIEAPDPVEENLYDYNDSQLAANDIQTLPQSLGDALVELKRDSVVQEALGEHVFEQYVAAKTQEWDEFRLSVSQWELDRYLEVY